MTNTQMFLGLAALVVVSPIVFALLAWMITHPLPGAIILFLIFKGGQYVSH